MHVTRPTLVVAAVAAALCLPAAAPAVVPPKDCGRMTVKGKRYQVKADQISCSTGRDHARRFLSSGRKPGGYKCRKFSRDKNKVNFQCNKGRTVFLAINR